MIVKKAWDYQNRIEQFVLRFYAKNYKHLRILPKIIVFMCYTLYFSRFISYRSDLIWWLVYTVATGAFIFFFPFSKFEVK